MKMTRNVIGLALVFSLLSATAFASSHETLFEGIKNDPNYSTLATALEVAGLASALDNSDSELTVFTPDNDVFNALPCGAVEALLDDTHLLKQILKLHVSPKTIKTGNGVMFQKQLNGGLVKLEFGPHGELQYVNDGSIIAKADLANGRSYRIAFILLTNELEGQLLEAAPDFCH